MTDHVKNLQSKAKASNALETRAVKAKEEMKMERELVQVVSDQADAISSERNILKEYVEKFQKKIKQRNVQLRNTRKELWKEKKRLESFEYRFFTSTYNMMARKAHSAGLDYKVLLLEGFDDPVCQKELPDEPQVVSSDPDEDLSD